MNNVSEKPPLFKKWQSWYLTIVLILAGEVALFYWITRAFG